MITYKLSDLKEKYTTETEDGVTYVYCQDFRIGILEDDTVTVPKHMINAGVLILLDDVPYKLARLVFIIQEVDDLLGIYPVKYFQVKQNLEALEGYFTVSQNSPELRDNPSDLRSIHAAIEKAFEPYCGKITVEGHWALWEGVPEQGYCLDYAVLHEM